MKLIKSSSCLAITGLVILGLHSYGTAGDIRPVVKENISQLVDEKSCPGCDLSGANLNRLDLSNVNLYGADLSQAQLFLTNLSGADLRNTKLQGAVFGGADLSGADLRGANVHDAKLSGAYLIGAKTGEETADDEGVSTSDRRDLEESPPAMSEKQEGMDKKDPPSLDKEDLSEVTPPAIQPESPPAKIVAPIHDAVISNDAVDKPMKEEVNSSELPPAKILDNTSGEVIPDLPTSDEEEKNNVAVQPINEEYVVTSGPIKKEAVISSGVVNEGDTLSVEKYNNAARQVEKSPPVSSVTPSDTIAVINDDDIKEEDISAKKNDVEDPEIENFGAEKKVVEESYTNRERLIGQLFETNKCYGCDLAGVDLSGRNLDEADLEAADLTGSNLENVEMQEANLKGALLINANLRNADLRDVDLYKADFTGADLTGANLKGARVDGAHLSGAKGVQMESVFITD